MRASRLARSTFKRAPINALKRTGTRSLVDTFHVSDRENFGKTTEYTENHPAFPTDESRGIFQGRVIGPRVYDGSMRAFQKVFFGGLIAWIFYHWNVEK